MFKIQRRSHADEPWFQELLERARPWPGFAEMWSSLPEDAGDMLVTQPIIPIEFRGRAPSGRCGFGSR